MADANGFSPLSEAPAAVRLAAAWMGYIDVTHPLTRFRPLEPSANELANTAHAPGQRVTWQVVCGAEGGNAFLAQENVDAATARLAAPDRLDLGDGETVPTTLEAILPGDWITSRHAWAGMVTGRVIERAKAQTLGDGFKVRTIRGVEDFIANGDVVIMGYMDCRPPETGEGDA